METLVHQVPSWVVSPLLLAFVLDLVFGDPYRLPHPIRLFGTLIAKGEAYFNHGDQKSRLIKGGMVSVVLVVFTYFFFSLMFYLIEPYPVLSFSIQSVFIFYGIANRSLINEALKVERKLQKEGVESARQQLRMIVGRDTSQLSKKQIRAATLETLSENLSDGVVAPLFFYALGGVPLMFAYKMINTLDSMVGYKNERYLYFGRVAARIDDVANFIPARLTAIMMLVLSLSPRAFLFIFKYGKKHASPNAAYPEAALAGILNCRFGGPNMYHGKMVDKPYIGENDREFSHSDIWKAVYVNMAVSVLSVLIIMIICL